LEKFSREVAVGVTLEALFNELEQYPNIQQSVN